MFISTLQVVKYVSRKFLEQVEIDIFGPLQKKTWCFVASTNLVMLITERYNLLIRGKSHTHYKTFLQGPPMGYSLPYTFALWLPFETGRLYQARTLAQ